MLDTEHPPYVEHLVGLINWSMNCEYPTPLSLYMDIIGYSEEHHGVRLCHHKSPKMGYLEISYLAEALEEYSNRPKDVEEWITKLEKEML